MEITLPCEAPAITLPNTAFFPQALMPLHIFEPRYRHMLRDVLASDRLMVVAGIDGDRTNELGQFELPHRVASIGIVRACQENDDGTSNLLLQGIARVEITSIVREQPYRRIAIQALSSSAGATDAENEGLRQELAKLLKVKSRLVATVSGEMTSFLKSVDDPEAFIDIAAFSFCEDTRLKQRLLETLDVNRRLALFGQRLRSEIESLKLQQRLQGSLPDDHISLN